jgi:ribonuclease HI
LFPLYEQVLKLKSQFDYIDFNHVYRENNKRADELANLALQIVIPDDELPILEEDWDQEHVIEKMLRK